MSVAFNPARRQLFRGDLGGRKQPLRPPWSVSEERFVDGCTRCDRCIQACPEHVLEADPAGFPQLNFQHGECTFCGDCVRSCPEPLFRDREESPWPYRAEIGERCVTKRGVICRSCGEQCEPEAIRFPLQAGTVAVPELDTNRCTGCGACVAGCPTQAISVKPLQQET